MKLTAAELARRLDAALEGDGAVEISGVAGVREAGPGEITFVANQRYAAAVAATRASAVVVHKAWDRPCAAPALLRVDDPDKAFARIAEWFAPPALTPPPGVHPTAIVAPGAKLGRDVSVGPYCVIEPGVRIGDGSALGAACYIGHDAVLGKDVKLYPHVTVRERVRIGDRVIVHNGTVIGSDGFGYTVDGKGVRQKIPQIGTVVIGDDVEIGANVTIDRARFGRTRIGNGVKIDNLVQIAHNVVIGDHAVIVAQVGIAGSAEVGAKAVLAGQAGVGGHLVIGEGAVVGGQAGVTKDVPPKTFVSGYPAAPHAKTTRLQAHVAHLPDLKKKVDELEARLKKLEGGRSR